MTLGSSLTCGWCSKPGVDRGRGRRLSLAGGDMLEDPGIPERTLGPAMRRGPERDVVLEADGSVSWRE